MFKIVLLLRYIYVLFLSIALSLSIIEASSSKIEIESKSIETIGDVVTAKNGVLIRYDGAIIHADTIHFNKTTKILSLDGNIEGIGYDGTKEHSSHIVINTDNKKMHFENLFLVSENDVWAISKSVNKNKHKYKLGASILSSCDITNPIWTMHFSNSLYDTDKNQIKVYNAKVYMWNIPVFYTPYMSFTTNKKRSSGLLFPLFGFTKREGYLFEQPIFWAISQSVDLELNPQIRTERSTGLYSTFRFADSSHSKGTLRVGYFKDKQSYIEEYSPQNSSHYGLEFNYESSSLLKDFLPKYWEDGLYINTTYLNDIDYLTLQKNNLTHFGLSPLQESRINYFMQNGDYYAGLNAKYFIDTRENINNDETLQVLPSIQIHKYLEHFMSRNFTYSIDFKLNNFDRKKGVTMKQAEFRVPLEFTTSFFDNFLNLSLGEEFYYSKFFFGNGDFAYNDFQYYSNIHKAKLFTDLTKEYDNFIHVMQPSLSYIEPGNEKQSPTEFSQLTAKQKELFAVGLPEEQYAFSLSQYFYDKNMKLKFYQRLSQKYYSNRVYKLTDLNNEMQYNFDNFNIYNIVGYSYEFKKLRFSSSTVSYGGSDYSISIGHSYKEVLPDDLNAQLANDITFNFTYIHNKQISFNGGLTYNIEDSSNRQWRFGAKYYRDCWSADVSISQDILPTSSGPISQNTYYVQLNFTPFGSVGTNTLSQVPQ